MEKNKIFSKKLLSYFDIVRYYKRQEVFKVIQIGVLYWTDRRRVRGCIYNRFGNASFRLRKLIIMQGKGIPEANFKEEKS
ncbi:hypothetical protein AALC75_27375 [Lachnospiraceae bacterium 48-42]